METERSQQIRKIWRFKDWQIQDIEGWLSDMSAQGWHLESIGHHFAKFVKGEPLNYRYFYSAFPSKLKEDFKADKLQAGWEYVASKGKEIQVFREPTEVKTHDSKTYFQERNRTINVLAKGILTSMLTGILGALAFI